MEKHGRLLPEEETHIMKQNSFTVLAAYAACHKWAQEKQMPHLPMKPKCHAFTHMVYDLDDCENPKYFYVFGEEDYMGAITKHAQSMPPKNQSSKSHATPADCHCDGMYAVVRNKSSNGFSSEICVWPCQAQA